MILCFTLVLYWKSEELYLKMGTWILAKTWIMETFCCDGGSFHNPGSTVLELSTQTQFFSWTNLSKSTLKGLSASILWSIFCSSDDACSNFFQGRSVCFLTSALHSEWCLVKLEILSNGGFEFSSSVWRKRPPTKLCHHQVSFQNSVF